MNKIRICLVGAGRVARVHGFNLKTHVPLSEIVAVVDQNLNAAKNLARDLNITRIFKDHQEALKWGKFDAAVVTTPTFTHHRIVVDMARAGKHVFCEKPISLTLEEADFMIEECKRKDVVFQIGFMRRFDPEFVQAKEKIKEGTIGEVMLVKSTGRGPGLPPEWALDIKRSGGMLAEVASHDFDCVMWLAGSKLEWVEAVGANFKCPDLKIKYPDFYDTAVVVGTFDDGKIGVIDMSCPVDYGYDARVEILGSHGVMFVGDVKGKDILFCTKEKGVNQPQYLSWRDRFREGYIAEMQHFIECIQTNRSPQVTGEDGRRSLACVLASNYSLKVGKKVKVNY